MTDQLPLRLRWPTGQRFDNFTVGQSNRVAIELLRDVASGKNTSWSYLAGSVGSGRTHALIATCEAASACGRSAQYLPLASMTAPADALRGVGGSDVLALDEIDAIAGEAASEQALFDLYNRCRAESATLIFASAAKPTNSKFALPDLVSRLAACTQLTLKPLDERERRDALRARARERGLELDDAVLDWLFARGRRDLASLIGVLDRIDIAALAAKRRVTVPFLRDLLGADS